jgi:hypothetical protein
VRIRIRSVVVVAGVAAALLGAAAMVGQASADTDGTRVTSDDRELSTSDDRDMTHNTVADDRDMTHNSVTADNKDWSISDDRDW